MVTDQSWFLLRLHKHYLNNLYYTAGQLRDQPNLYLSAMELLGGK